MANQSFYPSLSGRQAGFVNDGTRKRLIADGGFSAGVAGNEIRMPSPDTAAFFDRMLATEEQIATANAARNYTAMFKNAADAGMSDQKFADYMALSKEQAEDAEAMLRSRGLRDMAWLQRTRTKFIAAKQAEAAEMRKAIRDEISKELAATPQIGRASCRERVSSPV